MTPTTYIFFEVVSHTNLKATGQCTATSITLTCSKKKFMLCGMAITNIYHIYYLLRKYKNSSSLEMIRINEMVVCKNCTSSFQSHCTFPHLDSHPNLVVCLCEFVLSLLFPHSSLILDCSFPTIECKVKN